MDRTAVTIVGFLLMALGFAVLSHVGLATVVSVVLVGALLLGAGVAQAVHAVEARHVKGSFSLHIVLGILYGVVGALLLVRPVQAGVALTLLMAAFFLVAGLARIIVALVERFWAWGWVLANGIATFLLGLFIWTRWPSAGLWVIGLFLGIDLLLAGASFVALSLIGRRRESPTLA